MNVFLDYGYCNGNNVMIESNQNFFVEDKKREEKERKQNNYCSAANKSEAKLYFPLAVF
jgi:hypothetical protein